MTLLGTTSSPVSAAGPRTPWKRRVRWGSGIAGAACLIGGSLAYIGPAGAQLPPVALELLAGGFSPDRRIRITAKGPSDLLQTRIVIQPGGDTGWHVHPGPVIVVVKSGTLTEYHENGCVSVYQPGSVFFETPGEVHRVVNTGTTAGDAYATFILPRGAPPLQPAPDPGAGECRPDHHRGGHGNDDRDEREKEK